jgi:Domain of unknown function (DUF3516)/DEAD/DEAH box helicase
VTSLRDRLPPIGSDPLDVVDAFAEWADTTGRPLYPHQFDAALALADDEHVVLATPTGSGKSLVALVGLALARNRGVRSVWTAPVKALVGEKFFDAVEVFGAEAVGLATGDASINTDAEIIVCTAEVFANSSLRRGDAAGVGYAFLDEFHFYGERDRGWAWQLPLLTLQQCQFTLASATLGDDTVISADLARRTGRRVTRVLSAARPTPLHHQYRMTPVLESVTDAIADGLSPIYVVHPSQAAAVDRASGLANAALTTKDQRDRIGVALHGVKFNGGFGPTLQRFLRLGVGVHHAGMLPRYRRLVETLAGQGLLPVVCGTDTLGVGVNLPIRTVLMTQLTKFDGSRVRVMSAREFHQLAGRAGRPGHDPDGHVWAQAPEHVIENERLLAKAGDDPKMRRRVKRVEPPKDFVRYDDKTFDRLIGATPEALRSQFRVTPDLVASALARGQHDGPLLLKELLRINHDGPERQRHHTRRAIAVFRALEAAGVAARERVDDHCAGVRLASLDGDDGAQMRISSPLAPFALELLDTFDRDDPGFALDVVSVVEAIVDNPMPILLAQQWAARTEAIEQMKADGVEYEERQNRVNAIEWPKPLAELLAVTFDGYRSTHQWLDESPSPKSIVREMVEGGETFATMVRRYKIERSEGLLLRYLTDVWRQLDRTVPDSLITDELADLTDWLSALIRATDASLLEEWTTLAGGPALVPVDVPVPTLAGPPRAWRTTVRTAAFALVELLARRAYRTVSERTGWPVERVEESLAGYWAEYDSIAIDAAARGPAYFTLDESVAGQWTVRQRLVDPVGDHAWELVATVDLVAAMAEGAPTLALVGVGAVHQE